MTPIRITVIALLAFSITALVACSDGGTPDSPPQEAGADAAAVAVQARDREIAALVAETADLRAGIEAAETEREALMSRLEQHQAEGQAALDGLMRELETTAVTNDDLPEQSLEDLAHEADQAFKERAQRVLESALEQDLAMQRQLEEADAELQGLRDALAEKEEALTALLDADQ